MRSSDIDYSKHLPGWGSSTSGDPCAPNPRSTVLECASGVHSFRMDQFYSVDRAVGTSSDLHTVFFQQFEGAFLADYVRVMLPPHTGQHSFGSWAVTSQVTSKEGP